MDSLAETAARIVDIESRQDEALRQLEALERRVAQTLAEHQGTVAAWQVRRPDSQVSPAAAAKAA